jgi:hypothetical protein
MQVLQQPVPCNDDHLLLRNVGLHGAGLFGPHGNVDKAHVLMARSVMARTVMSRTVMARTVMSRTVMSRIVMARTVMARTPHRAAMLLQHLK